ncbi:MAG: trypsin-like peptidase domain-containing protein [Acidobacteriota bacterium]|jgi:serine protease Do|nr:trypsin-like peptidase domain-containing protein [Acidobacteriota bacterium]
MSDKMIINDPSEKAGRGKQIFGFLMVLLVLALGIGIGTLITDRAGATGPGDSQLQMQPAGKPVNGPLQAFSQAFEEVSNSVSPAVVNINTEEIVSGQQRGGGTPFDLFDFFGNQFGGQMTPAPRRERVIRSLGSGVIVDPKGYIITNNHVVEGATKIKVNVDGVSEEYTARLIGTDPEADIAVIKIDGDKPFPYARIGNSQSMKVGDWVVAIGSPFGLAQTVTAGIISATGRTFNDGGASLLNDYLQTDAAINSGNSGGPLANMSGEVVGINSFISTGSSFNAGNAGIGFAVPSHIFVKIYNQILETGRFSRGWIGVSMNNLPFTPALAEHFGVKQGSGVLITQLMGEDSKPSADGPAAKAGIKPEDVIVEFDGAKIKDVSDFRMAVANTVPGKTVKVKAVRFGEEKTFDVVLAERKMNTQERQGRGGGYSFEEEEKAKTKPEIGLEFDNAPPRLAKAMDISGGAYITTVKPGSLADNAGLAGQNSGSPYSDVVVAVNGKPVANKDDLLNIVKGIKIGSPIVIKFLRYSQEDNSTSVFYTSIIKP